MRWLTISQITGDDPQDEGSGSSNGASLHPEIQFQYMNFTRPDFRFLTHGEDDEDESPRSSGWTTPDPSMVFRFDQVTGEIIPPAGYRQDGTRLPPVDEAGSSADPVNDDCKSVKANDQIPEDGTH